MEYSLNAAAIALADFLPSARIRMIMTEDDLAEARLVAKQALVVILDEFVRAADSERMVTYNDVMDAWCRCWSDYYRQAIEGRLAFRLKDMKIGRVKASRRDLWCANVQFAALWDRVIKWSTPEDPDEPGAEPPEGKNALFYLIDLGRGKQTWTWDESEAAKGILQRYNDIVGADRRFRRTDHSPRLLIVGSPEDDGRPAEPRRRIAGEREYESVEIGSASEDAIRRQQSVHLELDVAAVRRSYDEARQERRKVWAQARALGVNPKSSNSSFLGLASKRKRALERIPEPNRARVKTLVARYDRLRGHIFALRPVLDDLEQAPPGPVLIKSKFTRTVNRRWQPVHFWPLYVSAKPTPWDIDEDENGDGEEHADKDARRVPPRAEWFRFVKTVPAGGSSTAKATFRPERGISLDVSSSQTQILALLLGLENLEAAAGKTTPSFKEYLAQTARNLRDAVVPSGLVEKEVGTLEDMCKEVWMQTLYGSTISRIVKRQDEEPWVYRWRPAVRRQRCQECQDTGRRRLCDKCIRGRASGATEFLRAVPFYRQLDVFLKALRHLAEVACARDPYAGIIFKDPFDKSRIRWNPIRRREQRVTSNGQYITVSVPRRRAQKGLYRGDGEVDLERLRKKAAPMLVHVLDAYFSALVIRRLKGIPVVGIHDAWLVPPANLGDLRRAVEDAAHEWFRGLKGIYDALIRYLDVYDPAKTYGPWAKEIKRRWEERRKSLEQKPARFAVQPWGTEFTEV